jgi:uncharacterized protein YkwD
METIMTKLTQEEQMLLEMMNRARLDPAAEAVRQGIDLNAYIAAGTISAASKQPLAGNNLLDNAAESHTAIVSSSGVLTSGGDPHSGTGDKTPDARISAAGYSYNWWAENVGTALGTTASEAALQNVHNNLFKDDPSYNRGTPGGHRLNILNDNLREVGIGVVNGTVNGNSTIISTEDFGTSGNKTFLTGAVYNDKNGDHFYGLGEAVQGVTATVTSAGAAVGSDATGAGGGWSVAETGGTFDVTFSGGGLAASVAARIEAGTRNAKVDLVNGNEIDASASATLGAGAKDLHLLGIDAINGTGNALDNVIWGNKGANVLQGLGGNDTIDGAAGDDTAVFSGARSQYQITLLNDHSVRIVDTRSGADGTDTVDNVEHFRFADATLNFADLGAVAAAKNTAPVAAIADHALKVNAVAQASQWLSYSDAENNAATQYQFWDGNSGTSTGYFSTAGNAHEAAGVAITVNAADLASVQVHAGTAAGSETMYVRAFDGKDWGAWDSFTLTTQAANNAPVAAIADHSLRANEWAQLSKWVTTTDADKDAVTQYQIWDGSSGANSGYFWTPDNAHQPAGQAITVNAADLANVWVRGGAAAGTETMYIRAFDGKDWGAWDSFTLATTPNTAPVATIADHTVKANEWAQMSTWLAYKDAEGNAATQYQFWDGSGGTNSGYFWTPDNAHQAAGQAITVDAAHLSDIWVRGGAVAGSDTMYVRAFDGVSWSAWDPFTLVTA